MLNKNKKILIDKKSKIKKRNINELPKLEVISDFGISFESIYKSLNEKTKNSNAIKGNLFV